MSTLAHSEPLPPSERADLLDALRGFALFGVLTSNMVGFSGALLAHVDPSTAATLTEFGLDWLMHGKFYSIFSLLFGIGFALQLGRLEARGEGVARYMRRLAMLVRVRNSPHRPAVEGGHPRTLCADGVRAAAISRGQ